MKPIKVGITGGIGVGKTTASRIFKTLGVPVYDADARAKQLLESDKELKHKVKENFGEGAYTDGRLNRRYLAEKVFSDSGSTTLLNSLVHPRVAADFAKWAEFHSSAKYVVNEAALLIESGSYRRLDLLIVVDAPEDLRVQRVLKRDPERSPNEVRVIIRKQKPQKDKLELADFVLTNDETESLISQVMDVHRAISGGLT